MAFNTKNLRATDDEFVIDECVYDQTSTNFVEFCPGTSEEYSLRVIPKDQDIANLQADLFKNILEDEQPSLSSI